MQIKLQGTIKLTYYVGLIYQQVLAMLTVKAFIFIFTILSSCVTVTAQLLRYYYVNENPVHVHINLRFHIG